MMTNIADLPNVTPRDIEWLQALANGVESKNLAGSTPQSARNRLCRLRKILGANTTVECVVMAMRKGLIK